MSDIERNVTRFSKLPVGPVGRHIKLVGQAARDKDLSALMESDLGRGFLRSFVVNTMDDQRALQAIFKRHYPNCKPPGITKMEFRNERLPAGNKVRAASTSDYTVLMDYMEVDNNVAFNYLLTHSDIATTLVLTEEQATVLFSDKSRVPHNARKAITRDFYRYFPATNNRNYSSYYMDRIPGKNLLGAADNSQHEKDNLSSQIADLDNDMEELQLEIPKYSKLIEEVCRQEQAATKGVESNRRGLQLVNVEIQKCRAAIEELADVDQSVDLQQLIKVKEDELTKKAESQAMLKDRVRGLKAAVKNAKEEWDLKKAELAAKRPRNDSSQELELMKGEIQRKQELVEQLKNTKASLSRVVARAKSDREEKLSLSERHRKEAAEKANGEEIGEVKETEEELVAKQKKLLQEKKKLIEESGGLSLAEFQAKYWKLREENVNVKKDIKECTRHVARVEKGLKTRAYCFESIQDSVGRMVMRHFSGRMKLYHLLGKLKFNHQENTLNFQIAHLSGEDDRKAGESMPLSSFSGGERSRSLACFILSLWELQQWGSHSPFRALDELDVFLDEMNKSQVEDMLLDFAADSKHQFIFISPHPPNRSDINVIEIEKRSNIA